MAVNINSELNTISTEIYGEEIRGAIHSALQKLANSSGGGGAGTANYNDLNNKPKINGVVLEGNKTSGALGINGSGGTTNYNELLNKPKINNVPLEGNVSLDALGISIGSGSGLSVKGYLPDNSDLDIYADTPYGSYTGIYVIDHDLTYLNKPANFNDNGILININCNDGDVSNYEYGMYVQILYPQDFLGTYWVRTGRDSGWKEFNVGSGSGSGSGSGATVDANTIYPIIKSYINANTRPGNTESDLYNFVENLGRELHYMGNIGASAILNTYNTRKHFGVYYIPSANVTSGNLKSQLPEDYDDSLNGIFIVTYIGTRFRQELSYLATGSTDTSKASAKWHRDYNSSSWSPWISDGASQSQVESIVNTYLAGNDAVAEAAGTAAQNYINTNGSSTIYPIITNYIQDYDGANPSNTALKTAVEGWIAAAGTGTSGGTTNYGDLSNKPKINNVELSGGNNTFDSLGVITTVKGLIEGYVDKDNNTNSTGKNKFNAAVDARIAAAGGSGSGGTVDKNSVYSIIEDYIAENTSTPTTKTALKAAVLSWDKTISSDSDISSAESSFRNVSGRPNYEKTYLDEAMSEYINYADSVKPAIADGIAGLAGFNMASNMYTWFPTPQMYGAKADGSTNDRSAIQAAINANKGKTLFFPAGTYMIDNSLSIAGSSTDYTDIIMDPSACIKATTTWGNRQQGGFMINIGTKTPGTIAYAKARKKIFMGGVIDSNTRGSYSTYGYIAGLMQVFPDVTDFDLSGTVFMATNTSTGFALGNNDWWEAKGELSTDAYVHHITLIKYSWNDAADPKVGTSSEKNRASGISIHTSDNNFENIRVYYFKRNVKITRGGGNYFSDIHTLGPAYSVYNKDTSGFFLEKKTSITLDQCYVDADNHFLYVADEAAGSRIRVSQCMHYQYGGSNGADRTMTAFYLGSANYAATGNADGIGEVTNLYVDQFDMIPNSKTSSISTDVGRHQGIAVSSSTGSGEYFANQVHNFNMVLNGIRILSPYKLKAGDLLRGAMSGEKGSVLFKKTTLARNGSTTTSNWYKICCIPVASGSAGKLYYRVKFYLDVCYFAFQFAIYRSGSNALAIGIQPAMGTQSVETDITSTCSNQFEIVFEEAGGTSSQSAPTAPYAYYMWLRMINAVNTANSSYVSRMIDKIVFDSTTAVTPAACQTSGEGFNNFISQAGAPTNLSTINTSKYGILVKCNDKSIGYLSSKPT